MMARAQWGKVVLAGTLAACAADPAEIPFEQLSDCGLFVGDGSAQEPADGVIPYAPVAPLFSDYSQKHRFIALPPGERIGYTDEGTWSFPDGTILVKTFAFAEDLREPGADERLIETRLLIRQAGAWEPYTYLWNDEQTEATWRRAGARVPVSFTDARGETISFDYRVPNENQCFTCHGEPGETAPLGTRTDQMGRLTDDGRGPENQIDYLADQGLFDRAPPAEDARPRLSDPFGEGPLEARARAYLHANCAHCHSPSVGFADSSGFYLNVENDDRTSLGVCKTPAAAGGGTGGLTYDIVPGRPEESILVFRMQSTQPNIRMPELGNRLLHPEGIELVSEWIAAMTPVGCP